jgi:phosphoribosylanthranilate isomerase
MTLVKICGLTTPPDIEAAVEAGADLLGFIMVPQSPRYIGADRSVVEAAPAHIKKVLVCRDIEEGTGTWAQSFDIVQFYDAPVGRYPLKAERLWRAVRVKGAETLDEMAVLNGEVGAWVLDAWSPQQLGGTGETFQWDLAVEISRRFPQKLVLAGGLNPDNVAQAVRTVKPWAVDVSSGVEASPGKKDYGRLRAFVQAVRDADPA